MEDQLRSAIVSACAEVDRCTSGRVLSAYVIGSRADDSWVPSSDLDVLLVVSGEHVLDAETLATAARQVPDLRTDFIVRSIDFYRRNGGPVLSSIGIHVYGNDVTYQIPPEKFEPYFVRKLLGFVNYQRIIRGTEDVLSYPVHPPRDARFSGYEVYGVLTKSGFRGGFRTLINLMTQGSTVLVGVKTGVTVHSKKQSVEAYAALADEPYAELVRRSYDLLNRKLHYAIPADAEDVEMAAEICKSTPAFENHVLMAVRDRFERWPSLDPDPLHRQMMASFRP
jgi:predicted nucleotidyltransferase